ncbi:MAG: PH domain-containing protein [Chitinophagales bacterium]
MEPKEFSASRLTEGNKLFPATIILDNNGVTFKVPSFFSGQETTIPYSRISSVNVNSPFVGYSDIIIETTGEGRIQVHGFTKDEVQEMKQIILQMINAL